jgi:uncharacterized membrane protein YraQ (UPF0718 family)
MNLVFETLWNTVLYVLNTLVHNSPALILGILVAAAIQVYIDPEKMKGWLMRRSSVSVPATVAFGAFTPFCACGTMAVVLSMLATALPWGPVMAFLTSSPLMSPEEFVMMYGILGPTFAIALVAASLLIGLGSGYMTHIIEKKTHFLAGGTWKYDIAEFGFKDNLTDLAASLGRRQLTRLDEFNEKRAHVVQRYFANLRDEEHLILPGFDEANHRAWHLFMVRVKNEQSPVQRDQVIEQLTARGIQTSVHFIPLHYFTAYEKTGRWKRGDFPVAERIFEGAISLPLFPDMTDEQVDEVCGALRENLHP